MRNLVILRGSPGAGKSTWIKENNLQNYTLCADDIRMMAEAPVLVADKNHRVISQKNDDYVWALLFELLEKRMSRGEFIIVDATHSRSSDFSKYKKMAEKYRYRTYYVDFSDVPIDVCKERNLIRESYKRVPEKAIDKIYARLKTQCKTSGYVEIKKDEIKDKFSNKPFDFNKWDGIVIFGDIHGCMEPLKKYFCNKMELDPNIFFIFTGDYLDRGIQNKEVLEFLISIKDKPNVLMLEGNHEKWLWYYANNEIEQIKSKTFLNKTIHQIKDIDTSLIRQFYRKLGQMAYFNYGKNTYIVTHGGLPYMPEDLQFVATQQLIEGVGDYTVNIDEIFNENMKDTNIYQVHGHRNVFGIDIDEYSHSLNLQGDIECGGSLRVVHLSKNEDETVNHNVIWFENDVYSSQDENIDNNFIIKEETDIVTSLRKNPNIRETILENNISSFNFTRDAFYNKNWDEETTKARGLFIDTETKDVVARGYNKFFNINETKETSLTHLRTKLESVGKAVAYKKYNGYLGLLSYVKGNLFFASKSTNQGDFAKWFEEIFYEQYSKELAEAIKNYMIDTNTTFVFEVIDPVNDPHIIKNDKREIILLDIIYNDIEFKKLPYEELKKLAENWKMKYKEVIAEFTNYREFMAYFLEKTNEDNFSDTDIEGVVIEIGELMTKLKFNYYNFWKQMRGLKEKVKGKRTIKLGSLTNDISNYFYKFLLTISEEDLNKDIISLREMFEKGVQNDRQEN